jgi:hypothetical protein
VPRNRVLNGDVSVIGSRTGPSGRPSGCLRHPREHPSMSVATSHHTATCAIGLPYSLILNLLICSLAGPVLAFITVRVGAALRAHSDRIDKVFQTCVDSHSEVESIVCEREPYRSNIISFV